MSEAEPVSDPCHPRSSAANSASLIVRCLVASAITTLTLGCTSTKPLNWETLKGPGFPGWNEPTAARARPGTPAPKPSGFFTDRRSEQIEQDLGGF